VDEVMKGKTSLVIAHRIETIVNSDRIHLFDRGQIIEEGSYTELMAKKRHFYNLERGAKMNN
jgi:ABC-type multidrug transport system fused ATPase/permease subunit